MQFCNCYTRFCDASFYFEILNLLVVVQSKHSVVVAEIKPKLWDHICGELTKNTFESVPLWWIKSTGVLTGDLDKGRCEPEQIVVVFFLFLLLFFPSKLLLTNRGQKPPPQGRQRSDWKTLVELAPSLIFMRYNVYFCFLCKRIWLTW